MIKWTICAQIIWLFGHFDCSILGNKEKSFKISITKLRPMSYVWLYSVNVMLCLCDAFVTWWCDWWFSCIYPINQNSILYLLHFCLDYLFSLSYTTFLKLLLKLGPFWLCFDHVMTKLWVSLDHVVNQLVISWEQVGPSCKEVMIKLGLS